MSILQQKIDPLSGQSEWVVVTDDHEEESSSLLGGSGDFTSSSGLHYTSYLDMLNDQPRNEAFDRAIRKAVLGAHHVLDIGAGTGLLSMMALRAMHDVDQKKKSFGSQLVDSAIPCCCQRDGFVTSCESYLPMIKLARAVLRANGMKAGVQLLHKRSDELHVGVDMCCQADVLVSEILDSELLGEGLIPTLTHAHKYLLKPNARTVPYRAIFYGQIVESYFLWQCHDLNGVESTIDDMLHLAPLYSKQIVLSRCSQYPLHVDPLTSTLRLLSEPFEVFTFEFWKTPETWNEYKHQITMTEGGKAHAIVSWWVLQLDEEGLIYYSTAPNWIKEAFMPTIKREDVSEFSRWCDHWKQCVWFIPEKGVQVQPGETLDVFAIRDEISVKYKINKGQEGACESPQELKLSQENCSVLKPERIGMLGDQTRRHVIMAGVKSALQGRSSCQSIVVDDSLISTISVALVASCSHVFVLLPSTRGEGMNLLESAAKLHEFSPLKVSLLSKRPSELTIHDLKGVQIDAVFAEPYYLGYEGKVPWQLLRFWYEKTMLKSLLAKNYTIVPSQAKLQGMAYFLPDLWESRCSLKKVEGFDHSLANDKLGACGYMSPPLETRILPYAIWQSGEHEALTEAFTLMRFDFYHDLETVKGFVKVPVSKTGTCHGIVLWMDWILDPLEQLVLSTGPSDCQPSYWKQGVKLFRFPMQVECFHSCLDSQNSSTFSKSNHPHTLLVRSLFDSIHGDVTIDVDFMSSI
ncbi:hypothetical protein O6H91_19G062300 [Diphasiastrum complanatum]|uniref:Uncharacterized protein n=1 Tax=Diphasiastrum complanatum TaxID=34168 RepID=A0ACC2AVR0_DIPCM|nr:hypothetical protein O6H91_19G062300 [Diphasiastrum complanatum]